MPRSHRCRSFLHERWLSQIARGDRFAADGLPWRIAKRGACRRTSRQTRRLQLQSLEHRAMLTSVVVDNVLDVVNGDTSSLAMLVASDGGDGISLREAIIAANRTDGADEISFDAGLSGQTLVLAGSHLTIAEALTIDATELLENVVIDAAEQSRIFNIDAPGTGADDFDVTLAGLTLQSGRTFDALERGGAIRSFATGTLTLEESTVHGNRTEAFRAGGGGIRAAGDLVLKRSTVSGNSTLGEFSRGGGIDVLGNVTLTQSTVSGNTTEGMSTDGAGIRATGAVTVTQSTVTGNQARAANATGGGIWNNNDPIVVINSILAGNTAAGGNAELRPGSGTLTVNYSLIGDTSDLSVANLDAINAGAGNLLDIDPLLDVLSDNGGPTETHALLAGSPAINAGDPSRVFDANEYDQRGATFFRVRDGRIDIGPFESGEMEPGASADFDGDSHIDGADFLAWQRGLGLPAAGKTDGDADNDNDVDVDDLKIWKQQFGQLDPPATISTVAAIPATASSLSGSLAVTTVPGDVALLRRAWHAAADQHAWPSDVEPFVPAETSLLSANFFVGRIEPPQRPTSPQNLPESLAVQAVDQFFSSKGSAEAVFASEADNWEVFE